MFGFSRSSDFLHKFSTEIKMSNISTGFWNFVFEATEYGLCVFFLLLFYSEGDKLSPHNSQIWSPHMDAMVEIWEWKSKIQNRIWFILVLK